MVNIQYTTTKSAKFINQYELQLFHICLKINTIIKSYQLVTNRRKRTIPTRIDRK